MNLQRRELDRLASRTLLHRLVQPSILLQRDALLSYDVLELVASELRAASLHLRHQEGVVTPVDFVYFEVDVGGHAHRPGVFSRAESIEVEDVLVATMSNILPGLGSKALWVERALVITLHASRVVKHL